MRSIPTRTSTQVRRGGIRLLVIVGTVFAILGIAFPAAAQEGSELRVSPPSGHFGTVIVGECDPATGEGCKIRTFRITNVGSAPIVIDSYGIAVGQAGLAEPLTCDDFIDPGVGAVLEPKESCLLSVLLVPREAGAMSGVLTVISTAGELLAEVPFSGTAVIR